MGRFIDIEKIGIVPVRIEEDGDILVLLSDVRKALKKAEVDSCDCKTEKWIAEDELDYNIVCKCSKCNHFRVMNPNKKYPYCEICGSRME